jgi:hypothetical protein
MKDRNEVIRALKCCIKDEDLPCEGNCPYSGEEGGVDKVMADALELLQVPGEGEWVWEKS